MKALFIFRKDPVWDLHNNSGSGCTSAFDY